MIWDLAVDVDVTFFDSGHLSLDITFIDLGLDFRLDFRINFSGLVWDFLLQLGPTDFDFRRTFVDL